MSRRPPPLLPPTQPGAKGNAVAKHPKRGPSLEGRQKLSELAKERHKVGGFKKGSGGSTRRRAPSRQRVATLVAEAARDQKNARAIIDVFKDAIQPTQPMQIRLKAVEAWLKVEGDDAKIALREADSESQERDRAELLEILSQKLTTGHSALLLKRQIERQAGIDEGIIDVEAVEDVSDPLE